MSALEKNSCALLVVDVQEKLLPHLWGHEEFLRRIGLLLKASALLDLPLLFTEQYPQGLGETLDSLKDLVEGKPLILTKTAFSAMRDPHIRHRLLSLPYSQWIVVGCETHICVLQTVRGLIDSGKRVALLKDCTSSRREEDCSCALQEMRAWGARISCLETALFELLEDARHPRFKEVQGIIK